MALPQPFEKSRAVPPGGTTGQVLAKTSSDDGNVEWANAATSVAASADSVLIYSDAVAPSAGGNSLVIGTIASSNLWDDTSAVPTDKNGATIATPSWFDITAGEVTLTETGTYAVDWTLEVTLPNTTMTGLEVITAAGIGEQAYLAVPVRVATFTVSTSRVTKVDAGLVASPNPLEMTVQKFESTAHVWGASGQLSASVTITKLA